MPSKLRKLTLNGPENSIRFYFLTHLDGELNLAYHLPLLESLSVSLDWDEKYCWMPRTPSNLTFLCWQSYSGSVSLPDSLIQLEVWGELTLVSKLPPHLAVRSETLICGKYDPAVFTQFLPYSPGNFDLQHWWYSFPQYCYAAPQKSSFSTSMLSLVKTCSFGHRNYTILQSLIYQLKVARSCLGRFNTCRLRNFTEPTLSCNRSLHLLHNVHSWRFLPIICQPHWHTSIWRCILTDYQLWPRFPYLRYFNLGRFFISTFAEASTTGKNSTLRSNRQTIALFLISFVVRFSKWGYFGATSQKFDILFKLQQSHFKPRGCRLFSEIYYQPQAWTYSTYFDISSGDWSTILETP